jgi:micrococcal nuclease
MILLALCLVASVTDGDTLRCQDGARLRLAAIDSPELHGCRPGRHCAPGDPYAGAAQLAGGFAVMWFCGNRHD